LVDGTLHRANRKCRSPQNQRIMKAFIDQLLSNMDLSHLSGHKGSLLKTKYLVSGGISNARRRKEVLTEFTNLTGESRQKARLKIILLPDVSKFSIELGRMSALLLSFGILKRMSNEITIERGKNGKFNKYLLWIYKRSILHLQNGEIRKF